jgi:hypothetical protein
MINGATGQGFAGGNSVTIDGKAYGNSYLASSVSFRSSWKSCIVKKNKCKPCESQKRLRLLNWI